MRIACKDTRDYIFSLPREKRRENLISKNELIFFTSEDTTVEGRKNYSPERFEGFVHVDLPF